ncbi:TPA: hypothetical protein MAN70_002758 [Klebsiella pneumoniae]|nr:hypothetical protein [Klebsiella pneumoniae]
MTITLQAVNELIQSLESAGELSIKERKYLDLAKAYADKESESVAQALTFEKCRELSGCPAGVDLQDWVKQLAAESLQWQMSIPHRIVAGIKADAANQMCVAFVKHKELAGLSDDDVVTVREATDAVLHCAELISEGADK